MPNQSAIDLGSDVIVTLTDAQSLSNKSFSTDINITGQGSFTGSIIVNRIGVRRAPSSSPDGNVIYVDDGSSAVGGHSFIDIQAGRSYVGYDGTRTSLALGGTSSKSITFDTNGSGASFEKVRFDTQGSFLFGTTIGVANRRLVLNGNMIGSTYQSLGSFLGIYGSFSDRFITNNSLSTTVTFISEYDNGNSGASKTIDWNNSQKQKITMTGNCAFTFTNPTYGVGNFQLRLIGDGTARTPSYPANVVFPNGVSPTITGTLNKWDIISFFFDGGSYSAVHTGSFG